MDGCLSTTPANSLHTSQTMITPEQLAKSNTEHGHQAALFCWATLPETLERHPDLKYMFAIPNGGERNKITASRLKAEGVKAGVLDIFLPVPTKPQYIWSDADGAIPLKFSHRFHGLFIELKVGKNRPTKEQEAYIDYLTKVDYKCEICYGWQEARDVIIKYMDMR